LSEATVGLKASALGLWGVAALGSVMMAPALGIYANLGLISANSGKVAPAVFLVALVFTLPTAVSYALIAREIPSAGSAYTWLSEAVNPFVGTWMGLLLVATYLFCVILQPILFGLFFNELLAFLFHIQTGYGTWMAGVLISTLIIALLAYPGIEIAAKSSLMLTMFESAVVLALSCTILDLLFLHGRLNFTPFNPRECLNGTHGFSGALVFGLLNFVGFGVIATAAEETHSPRSVIPRAMMLACVILGIFWAFTSWGFSLTLPPGEWGQYVDKGVNPVALVARQYWHGGSILVIITAITAVLGVYLASVVGYARVTYAMARDGTLPAFLGKLHPKHRVPWNAQHLAFVVTLAAAAFWGRWAGTYLSYDWWGSAVVFFSMVSNIFVCVGCSVFFYRFRRNAFNWLVHGLVPVIGTLASMLPLYYSFGPDLWNLGWKKGQSIVLFSGLVVVSSALYTVGLRYAKPEVLQRAAEKTHRT
jgi:amino acid transporter